MGGIEEKDTALSHDASSHKSKLYIPHSLRNDSFPSTLSLWVPSRFSVSLTLSLSEKHTWAHGCHNPSADAGRGITTAMLCWSQT